MIPRKTCSDYPVRQDAFTGRLYTNASGKQIADEGQRELVAGDDEDPQLLRARVADVRAVTAQADRLVDQAVSVDADEIAGGARIDRRSEQGGVMRGVVDAGGVVNGAERECGEHALHARVDDEEEETSDL